MLLLDVRLTEDLTSTYSISRCQWWEDRYSYVSNTFCRTYGYTKLWDSNSVICADLLRKWQSDWQIVKSSILPSARHSHTIHDPLLHSVKLPLLFIGKAKINYF